MIDVVWLYYSFGNWDHGLLASIFNKHPDLFHQWNVDSLLNEERQIVIISGKPDVRTVRNYLEGKNGLVILASNEDADFDWKAAIPESFEIWTSYYYPSTKSDIKTRLLLGAPNRIKDYKINKHLEKKYLWSFVGQVQNEFRQKCVEELSVMPGGFMKVISGFGGYAKDAMEYQEYLDIMCQSEFVICPSGSQSADSFRVYEAMECGATPIADKRSPRDAPDFNYWNSVYPENKLLTVDSWDDFYLSDHNTSENIWWNKYKTELEEKLIAYANG